jgi:Domain of unknown function (DUF4133)
MTTSVYPNYRAINRPMSFKGLKGQYIIVTAGALVSDLLLFVILYCCKVPSWICIGIAFGLGAGAVSIGFRLNQRYGIHGLKKKRVRRRAPAFIRCRSRQLFTTLNH